MIKTIDDILCITSESNDKNEKKEIYLVLENNNLTEALFNVIKNGYEPRIKFEAGIISEIKIKFNKTKYIIKTQNLLKTSCNGCITLTDEKNI